MSFKKTLFAAVVSTGAVALAQTGRPAAPPAAPTGEVALTCPTGSRLVGGPKSVFEASVCMRSARDGSRTFHGPYVAFWPNGQKQAQGQFDEGRRTGKWFFFDEAGKKTGETTFKLDLADGPRVEFFATGEKKLEEVYSMGRRQGAQVIYDRAGKIESKIDFLEDRPVTVTK